jgi:hypothetical protein
VNGFRLGPVQIASYDSTEKKIKNSFCSRFVYPLENAAKGIIILKKWLGGVPLKRSN